MNLLVNSNKKNCW